MPPGGAKISARRFAARQIFRNLSFLPNVQNHATALCCKEKYKQEVKICSISTVIGLYLVPGKCQISKVSGASLPGPPPECYSGPTWGLTAGLGNDELFDQVPFYGF